MTDIEALEILRKKYISDIQEYSTAIYNAAKRLEDCCWYDYDPRTFSETYRLSYGTRFILGIRYDDGTCGSVDGIALYDPIQGWNLSICKQCKSIYTDRAVIEKFMKYPDYNG